MIKNILINTLKGIKLRRISSIVKIVSLSIGLICLLIFSAIFLTENTYDNYLPNKDRLFRLLMIDNEQGKMLGYHSGAALDLIVDKFPQIEKIVRVLIFENTISIANEEPFNNYVLIVDPGFFSLFDIELPNGDSLLKLPDKLFLSQSEAKRLFKNTNPIGQLITLNNSKEYAVAGVFNDIPEQSHLSYNYLISTESIKNTIYLTDFNYKASTFYILLKDSRFRDETEQAITDFISDYFKVDKSLFIFKLQKVTDIYLYSKDIQQHTFIKSGNLLMIQFIPWLAILIISVVIGNYMIQDIGNCISNIFKIGLYKTFGESNMVRFFRFYFQNLVYFIISSLFSLLAIYYFGNKLSGLSFINLNRDKLLNSDTLLILVVVIVLISIIPSVYANQLAKNINIPDALRYKSSRIVEYKIAGSKYSINIRRIMLGIQIFTSICLIVASLVATNQINYLVNLNLGIRKENVIVVNNTKKGLLHPLQRYSLLKQKSKEIPFIQEFSSSSDMTLNWLSSVTQVRLLNQPIEKEIPAGYIGVDYNFFRTLNAVLIEGRDFNESISSDSTSNVIINKTLAKQIGENIIGKKLIGFWGENEKTIIGIVDDIYFGSTNKLPEPMTFVIGDNGHTKYIYYRYLFGTETKTIETLKDNWNEIDPSVPFGYFLMEEFYQNSCKKEVNIKNILIISALISLLLSLVGIFSVGYVLSKSRMKEMSIRRVLGANPVQIFKIFISEFINPFIIASFLAVPLIYITLNDWLTKYANRADIEYDSFLFALLIILMILSSISFIITYRVSRKNLANNLRYE